MADIIATIWDFDKTLITGYMQTPLFEEYGVDEKDFWNENERTIKSYSDAGISVNEDTFYLNLILKYVREGKFKGLSNNKLLSFGQRLHFRNGAEGILKDIKKLNNEDNYKFHGIKFENYIVSTGLKRIIEGTKIIDSVEKVWGCEFVGKDIADQNSEICEYVYSLDHTTKTRALFEINKGIHTNSGIDVNSKIPEEERRVQFVNMIYIADGPSDIPAFSVLKSKGGSTLAVYDNDDERSFEQADELLKIGRVNYMAEADFGQRSAARKWILKKIKDQAEAIIKAKKEAMARYKKGTPEHLM